MSDQVTNKSAGAEQSQVRVLDTALPSSTSLSDKLLSRIATLLFILVAGVLTVFGYYASSICITVVLAGFLAILFEVVALLNRGKHNLKGGVDFRRNIENSNADVGRPPTTFSIRYFLLLTPPMARAQALIPAS